MPFLESAGLVSCYYVPDDMCLLINLTEYAAAFFLLAGNLQDAVNVCAHQLQDLQLAVAVARVYEGDNGSVVRSLLEDKVLPQAALEGNRWLATWSFWMLGRRDMAVRALIVCPHDYATGRHALISLYSLLSILWWTHPQPQTYTQSLTWPMIQR